MVRISFITCVFLVGLRLVIGWHFFFEGVNKYQSMQRVGAETSKPFSSKGYFAEAEGPLGPSIRGFIGDEDAKTLAKLTLAETSDDKPSARMPVALAKEWDDYARQFADFYHLSDEDKKLADEKLLQAKSDYALWLTDKMPPAKDRKEKASDDDPRKSWITGASVGAPALIYRPEAETQQRILAYKQFINQVRDDYEHVLRTMGKDVELVRLRTLKTMTADARRDLMKDVDEHTKKMKEALANVVGAKLAGCDIGPEDPKIDERVRPLVTLNGTDKETGIDRMPVALGKQWDDYAAYWRATIKDKYPKAAEGIDEVVKNAKVRYVRFLLDQDQYTGKQIERNRTEKPADVFAKALERLETAKKNAGDKLSEKAMAEYEMSVAAALDKLNAALANQSRQKNRFGCRTEGPRATARLGQKR